MTTFINSELSQSIGIGMSLFCTWMFRVVNVASVTRRLVLKMWDDIARLGDISRAPSMIALSVRMVDGISLLVPRLSQLEKQKHVTGVDGLSAAGILSDLCVGLNMARLLRLERRLLRLGVPVRPLLQALSGHYRDRMAARPEGDAGILAMLDAALEDVAMLPAGPVRKAAMAALAGIRRDLFRNTAPFPAGKSAYGEDGHETGLSVANGS